MTYYEVLELDPSASAEEIERAFKRLARQVHPDLSAGDRQKAEARMKQLNEIRDTLTDPLLRAGYDERLRVDRARARGPAAPPPTAEEPPAPAAPRERPRRASAARAGAPSSAPWLLFVLGASAASGLLWHWRHDLPWASAATTPAEPAAATGVAQPGSPGPASPSAPAPAAPRPPKSDVPAHARPPGRGVVRLGSGVNEVLGTFGTPDRIEPGKRPGDAVFVYGTLRLQITNGRVTGSDAAVLR